MSVEIYPNNSTQEDLMIYQNYTETLCASTEKLEKS